MEQIDFVFLQSFPLDAFRWVIFGWKAFHGTMCACACTHLCAKESKKVANEEKKVLRIMKQGNENVEKMKAENHRV